VLDRLRRFTTADSCGQWNATLSDDFRSDTEFLRNSDELFREVVSQYTGGKCVASDGVSLETVRIQVCNEIHLYFHLYFLDAPEGFDTAPAKFSVFSKEVGEEFTLATISCGLREPYGRFWHPPSKGRPSILWPDANAWALTLNRTYGPPTIASWMARRRRRPG